MMESVPVGLAMQIGGLIVSAAILALGLKFAVNGMRLDVSEIKRDLKTLLESDAKQNERLVAVETEADARSGWIKRIEDSVNSLRELVGRRS